jgi:tetratricopeptide (TPR) repeat protein
MFLENSPPKVGTRFRRSDRIVMFSPTRLFRLGIRFAVWVEPHVKEWHRQRHHNRVQGQQHLASRNWAEAEKHLNLALNERRHAVKKRVGLLLDLEQAQRRQRKYSEAEQTARTALDLASRARNHSGQARAMEAFVEIYLDQGKWAEAEQATAEVVRLERARSKPDHARLAKCSRKLGTALLNGGRTAEALEAFQQSAKLCEQTHGANHAETATTFVELGMLYRQHGEHTEAQRHLRRALEIHRTIAGPDSNEATQDLYHLAASLAESGDLNGAVAEFERLLAVKDRQVGGNRAETAEAQVRLAVLYMNAGRPAPAYELLMQAIGFLERKGGGQLLLAMETMACVQEQMGHGEDAKHWRDRALTLAESSLP